MKIIRSQNISIKIKLISFAFFMCFLILLMLIFSVGSITKISEQTNNIRENYVNSLINLSNVTTNLYSAMIESKDFLLLKKTEILDLDRKKNIREIEKYLKRLKKTLDEGEETLLFKKFKKELENFKRIYLKIGVLSLNNKDEEAIILSSKKLKNSFSILNKISKKMILLNLKGADQLNEKTKYIEKGTSFILNLYGILFMLTAISISYFLIKNINFLITQLKNNLLILGKGAIPKNQLVEKNTEIGKMGKAINKISDNYNNLAEFANELGKTKFDTLFKPLSSEDILGSALMKLRNTLKKAEITNQKNKIDEDKRTWINNGLNELSNVLRDNSNDLKTLSYNTIVFIIKYLDANQGGLFLINNRDSEDIYIEQISCFAYDRKRKIKKRIELDEGLIGRCIDEKKNIYLMDLPETYMNITSGLGSHSPRNLFLFPLILNEKVFGVIEIASFYKILKHQIEFLEKSSEIIASTISNVRVNEQTNFLFKQSKRQAEEMISQEEELRQNLEELKATQESAYFRESKLKKELKETRKEINRLKLTNKI